MRIAHVLGTFDRTGVTSVVISLSNSMNAFGHDVDIITWDNNNTPKLTKNINVRNLNIFGLSKRPLLGKFIRKFHKYLITDILYYYLYSYFFSNRIKNKLSKYNYNQIYFHGMRYFPFHKINIPHIIVAHNTKSLSLLNSKNRLLNIICKYCLKKIYKNKTILTVSEGVKNDLVDNFSVDKSKVFCVYNPFNIEIIRQRANEFVPLTNKSDGYIISIGRSCKQKRFDILLGAYAASGIKEYLVIVGSNKIHHDELKKLTKSLNIENKVVFISHQENIFPYIKNSKLLVVTSEYEGFGNTIIESLICGTPVVSTNCKSGPSEILTGLFSDYLAEVNNPSDIANKIKAALKNYPPLDSLDLKIFSDTYVTKKYLEHANNIQLLLTDNLITNNR